MTINIELMQDFASHHRVHSRDSGWWQQQNAHYSELFEEEFSDQIAHVNFGTAGKVEIKNIEFGSISSKHLFGLDELIIFSWYEKNKHRYKKTLDLGANIGLHSLLMHRLGALVTSYEPDPIHIKLFYELMDTNSANDVELRERAIGTKNQKMNFTRVLGNTTSSHLTGAKLNPYGELENFEVEVDSIVHVLKEGFDFVKMDVEGYEVKLIQSLEIENFNQTEIMLEVGTPENAAEIFHIIERIGINAFSQKLNWEKVTKKEDLPTSHKEGSLFLSTSTSMDWNRKDNE